MARKSSAIPGFRRLSMEERRLRVAALTGLDAAELASVLGSGGLDDAGADQMVENALGTLALPFGVGLHFQINGRDRLVPMVIEEPSVIAAASHAAKRVRAGGGFVADVDDPIMIAQIEVHEVGNATRAITRIRDARAELLAAAERNLANPVRPLDSTAVSGTALTSGGGAVDLAAFEGGCRESPGKLALLLGSEGPGLTQEQQQNRTFASALRCPIASQPRLLG